MPLAANESQAKVAFIGAGPGDPELLTVKAQRLIAQADVIIYADSLVSPDICRYVRPEAVIYGSAALTLEAILDIILRAVSNKQFVVRIQSGDPTLYGALHEQRLLLDRHGIDYIIVPGVSSVFAAAAALGVELTVPDVSQSLILTRHAGRILMPEKESLRSFASHTTTLCIFLSITRVHQIVEELLAGGYSPDTPVAVVYRATWPDQKLIRSTITELVRDVKAAKIARQALIMVGWALATTQHSEANHRSHLYQPTYKHLFRSGTSRNEVTDADTNLDVDTVEDDTLDSVANKAEGPLQDTTPSPLQSLSETRSNTSATKRIALVVLTGVGLALAKRIQTGLKSETPIYASQRAFNTQDTLTDGAVENVGQGSIIVFEAVGTLLAQLWKTHDQLVLFFALGAAVRLITPLLQHKHQDPGVVVIDDAGRFAISVVSGHMGDANGLAQQCASLLDAQPVITTASDVQHTLAADLLARNAGWHIEDTSQVTKVSASIVNGERVGVLQEAGERGWWNAEYPWPQNLVLVGDRCSIKAAGFAALLIISDRLIEDLPEEIPSIIYRPPTLVLGIGCRRGISLEALDTFIRETLVNNRIAFHSITVLATADIKADEVALQMLAQRHRWSIEAHPVEALKAVPSLPNPSERVLRLVGTPGVCEAAALLSSKGGELLVSKHKGKGMTIAVARRALSESAGTAATAPVDMTTHVYL